MWYLIEVKPLAVGQVRKDSNLAFKSLPCNFLLPLRTVITPVLSFPSRAAAAGGQQQQRQDPVAQPQQAVGRPGSGEMASVQTSG